jgi:hypothetical protein
MKRWLLPIVVVAIVVVFGAVLRSYFRSEAKNRREAAYQSALQSYSENLKPGLARKDVENYLRARNTSFSHMCCLGEHYYVDLAKVGEEAAPWYCSEAYVYVAFEFAAVEPHDPLSGSHFARDSDVLKRIEIFRPLTGCL